MGEKCFCHLNGLAVKDATARKEIDDLKRGFITSTTKEIENIKGGFITPEMFGAIGDGVTCDADAFINAIKTGKKVVCDSSKTYYFSKPVDVREILKGHLDGNNAYFINFHIYINVNESFNGQYKPFTADRFTIENIVLGSKDSDNILLEGWETPCITSGSPMIIRNIITRSYPYIYALVGTYIDLIQIEQWTNALNKDLFDTLNLTLDTISYLNSNGNYSRFDNNSNTIAGDGWKISQCQEFYDKYNSDYKFLRISNNQPIIIEECVQCSIEIVRGCQLVVIGCHYENATVELNCDGLGTKITFINTFFYPSHTIIDNENVIYINCFFQAVEDIQYKRTLATITNNKSWYDLKCTMINCTCPLDRTIDTQKIKSFKNAPKKTYNTKATHYVVNDFNNRNIEIENRWISTFFESVGEYKYDIYLFATSIVDVATAHKHVDVTIDNVENQLSFKTLYVNGGFRVLIVRQNPDGQYYKTEYYIDPSIDDDIHDSTTVFELKECGSLAIFRISSDNVLISDVAMPWIPINEAPQITIKEKLFEANGGLVTTDNSIFSIDEWHRQGFAQFHLKDGKYELISPNGTKYKLKVSDDGALSTSVSS